MENKIELNTKDIKIKNIYKDFKSLRFFTEKLENNTLTLRFEFEIDDKDLPMDEVIIGPNYNLSISYYRVHQYFDENGLLINDFAKESVSPEIIPSEGNIYKGTFTIEGIYSHDYEGGEWFYGNLPSKPGTCYFDLTVNTFTDQGNVSVVAIWKSPTDKSIGLVPNWWYELV